MFILVWGHRMATAATDRHLTVMIVDDDIDQTYILRGALRTLDVPMTVIVRHNGDSALGYLKNAIADDERDFPDIILLDVHMPVMNGIEFLQTIKALPDLSAIPNLVLTGDASPNTRDRLIECGAISVILKTESVDGMQNIVRDVALCCLDEGRDVLH